MLLISISDSISELWQGITGFFKVVLWIIVAVAVIIIIGFIVTIIKEADRENEISRREDAFKKVCQINIETSLKNSLKRYIS